MTSEERDAATVDFLASIPRRTAALEDVTPLWPFDPAQVAAAFVFKIEGQADMEKAVETYAYAIQKVPYGDGKSWRAIHAAIEDRFGPAGLDRVKTGARKILNQMGIIP